MEILHNENDVKFNILSSCSHCLIFTLSNNTNGNHCEEEGDGSEIETECNGDDTINKKELVILQKKDKVYKDFINLSVPTDLLTNIQKIFEKSSCTNKNRCCRYYELLICESLKSIKEIELNPIIDDINNNTNGGLRRRSRRTRSNDFNLSRTLDYQKRLQMQQQYHCIEQCFETLIALMGTLTKWHWINDLYLKIYRLLEQSNIYEIMGKLCNIPLLEVTCNPSLYRHLFKLYKYLILYGFVQPWEKHQELSDHAHKLINAARDFLDMVGVPENEGEISEDGLISVSKYIINEWDGQK